MIALTVRAEEPHALRDGRRALSQRHPSDLEGGSASLSFDPSVYAHREVKIALIEDQHGKCAFCESKVRHVSPGDVEHYRPKAAVCQSMEDPLERPGYFWLAYAWENLLFACEMCNRRHKASVFPLHDPGQRVRSPADPLTREAPLFLNPRVDNPAEHIGFRQEVPYAIAGSVRGEVTIEALGLRRAELEERRRTLLSVLDTFRSIAEYTSDPRPDIRKLAKEAVDRLGESTRADAEFAAMARALLSSR